MGQRENQNGPKKDQMGQRETEKGPKRDQKGTEKTPKRTKEFQKEFKICQKGSGKGPKINAQSDFTKMKKKIVPLDKSLISNS